MNDGGVKIILDLRPRAVSVEAFQQLHYSFDIDIIGLQFKGTFQLFP